jgi:hypothetical protein
LNLRQNRAPERAERLPAGIGCEERHQPQAARHFILIGDGRDRETARIVRVAQSDDVEQELFFAAGFDRFVLAEAIPLQDARAEGAAGRTERAGRKREQGSAAGPKHAAARPPGECA